MQSIRENGVYSQFKPNTLCLFDIPKAFSWSHPSSSACHQEVYPWYGPCVSLSQADSSFFLTLSLSLSLSLSLIHSHSHSMSHYFIQSSDVDRTCISKKRVFPLSLNIQSMTKTTQTLLKLTAFCVDDGDSITTRVERWLLWKPLMRMRCWDGRRWERVEDMRLIVMAVWTVGYGAFH